MRAELASMTRLNELSTRLTATSDLQATLYEILDAIIELQGADFGDVQLYDEATGTLKIVAHRGLDHDFLDYFATVDANDRSACGLALRAGTRIIIEDVNADADFEPHWGVAAATGFRACSRRRCSTEARASRSACCRRTFASRTARPSTSCA
jgi:GAF domain-containing protein